MFQGFSKDTDFVTLSCVDSHVYSLDKTSKRNQIVSASQQDEPQLEKKSD